MMPKTFAVALALVTLAGSPALAQSESEQILQLLKGMDQKFDSIEKRLDKIEGGSATGNNPAADTTPSKKKATPGWQIALYPYGKSGLKDISTGRAHVPIGPLPYKLNLKSGPVSSYVEYRGKAFFKAAVAGEYGFGIDVDASSGNTKYNNPRYSCISSLNIDDQSVIPREEKETDFSTTGGVSLQEGTYEISFRLSCRSRLDSYTNAPNHQAEEILGATTFEIRVIGPDDTELRKFEPSELFTVSLK